LASVAEWWPAWMDCASARATRCRPQDLARLSQRDFDAVDLRSAGRELSGSETDTLTTLPVDLGEQHGTLRHVASTLDLDSGVTFESMLLEGMRVITFERFLRGALFPLPTVLSRVLDIVADGFGSAVELEFAFRFTDPTTAKQGQFHLLQARPMASLESSQEIMIPDLPEEQIVLRTSMAMGHGSVDELHHLVFVDPEEFSLQRSSAIAAEVGALNNRLTSLHQPYGLLGPGRWGTCNPSIGIPVNYAQVDGARLIAELASPSLRVQPSQGTHFFHNVVAGSLFYFMVDLARGDHLDLGFLRAQPNWADTRYARLLRIDPGLSVRVQGKERLGVIFRP
jgi:hypothetical protein